MKAIVVTDQAAGKAGMKLVERRLVETGDRRPVASVSAIRGRVLRRAKRPTTLLRLCRNGGISRCVAHDTESLARAASLSGLSFMARFTQLVSRWQESHRLQPGSRLE